MNATDKFEINPLEEIGKRIYRPQKKMSGKEKLRWMFAVFTPLIIYFAFPLIESPIKFVDLFLTYIGTGFAAVLLGGIIAPKGKGSFVALLSIALMFMALFTPRMHQYEIDGASLGAIFFMTGMAMAGFIFVGISIEKDRQKK